MTAVTRKHQLLDEARKIQKESELKGSLPHLFKIKPYRWMLQYWGSTNRMKFICAGNQVGKSTAQIIHVIDLATDKKKWSRFFPKRPPQVFWYIYPSKSKIQEEYKEKWVGEYLPRFGMEDHPIYGWEKFNIDGEFAGIKFKSGVSVYFKSWGVDLQAGTVDGVFSDEEMPAEIYPELSMRLTATHGMFSKVFTATKNQPFWFDVIERRGRADEKFPEADKWQISMEYDCKYFADGTPSHFTDDEINRKKNAIGDPVEIERRIHGKFVTSEGRKYKTFSKLKNVKPPETIPRGWEYYAGVDIGTGGEGHPAAISIVAVRPDYQMARMIKTWRGNEDENTTTTQILNQYIKMTRGLTITSAYYDWHSKEFALRAESAGIPFAKAEKDHQIGEDILNTLFHNQMLVIEVTEHSETLIQEFETLKADKNKRDAKDDQIDSLRYAVSSIQWDFSNITSDLKSLEGVINHVKTEAELRAESGERMVKPKDDNGEWDMNGEIDFYNNLVDAGFDDFYGE